MRIPMVVGVAGLVLACGVSFTYAQAQPAPKVEKAPVSLSDKMKAQTERIQEAVTQMAKDLQLTTEQQAKVKEILAKTSEETGAIAEEVRTKLQAIRSKTNDAIAAILTDKQKVDFDKFIHPAPIAAEK